MLVFLPILQMDKTRLREAVQPTGNHQAGE